MALSLEKGIIISNINLPNDGHNKMPNCQLKKII